MTQNLAFLLSGGGRTLQNFIDLIEKGELDAKIQVVIASNGRAQGLQKARAAGIPTAVVQRRDFDSVEGFSEAITEVLDGYPVDIVVLAGFLQLYLFPERFRNRVINIHPALLPNYGGRGMYGHHVHEAVIAAGETESGCSVHIADHEYDHGPVILQKKVPVYPDDTPESLAERVFEAEKEAYPAAVRMFAEGTLPLLQR